jgi:uncharacterized protein (DUF433 family)
MNAEAIHLNERIVCDPEICHGKPTVMGTRVMVQAVLELLAAGDPIEEALVAFPRLTREDVLACIASAAELMSHPPAFPQSA